MLESLVAYLLFLVGAFLFQANQSAFRVLEHTRSSEQLREMEFFSLYRHLHRYLSPHLELELLFFSISCAKHLTRLGMAVSATILIWLASQTFSMEWRSLLFIWVAGGLFLIFSLFVADFGPRYWGLRRPIVALRAAGPLATIYLFALLPIIALLLLLTTRRFATFYVEQVREPMGQVKEKIIEMLHQAGTQSAVDEEERRLLESAVMLRDRIVREVMIPRVEMVSLPASAKVRDAAALFDREGYSRVPIYRKSVDQIIGLLLHKDIAKVYLSCERSGSNAPLDETVEALVKPVLYVPETRRVSRLLQEFRRRQSHLAVVVDEYGGTEGLVTIEDCLEEIVGDIADEFDVEEEQFVSQGEGAWIVDARMTLDEIEDEFGIEIPQEGEYDTIGGYAFHRAGEIPQKGLRIHHDAFDLEVVESGDRCVEKVLIKKIIRSKKERSEPPSF